MNTIYLLGALGLLTHLILKYWMEDGSFAENFLSARTARYVLISIVGVAVTLLLDEAMSGAGAYAVGIAGGSIVAMGQKVAGDNSPAAKRTKVMSMKDKL